LNFSAAALPGDRIAQIYTQQKPPIQIGNVNAKVKVDGNVNNLVTRVDWQAPESAYAATGNLVIAQNGQRIDLQRLSAQAYGGMVSATGQLRDRRWSAKVRLTNANLAALNPQLEGRASGTAVLRGNIDQPTIDQTSGEIKLTAQTYGGQIDAIARLANRRWQADVNLAGVQLAQANRDLRGAADGQVSLRGSLASFDLPQVFANSRAAGQVRLSQGVAVVTEPIKAQFNWDGQKINLLSATAPNLSASGQIFAKVQGTPAITGLDLRIDASNLLLSALPLALPEVLQVSGLADFDGRLKGALMSPQIQGEIALRNFGVAGRRFEFLSGQVDLRPGQGLKLDMAGNQDRLALALNAQNQPIAVNVQQGDLRISGQAQGDLFQLALAAIPLSEVNRLNPALPQIKGQLSGNVTLDLARNEFPQANLVIDQVAAGAFPYAFRSGQIKADLSYVRGVARGNVALLQPRLGTIESNDVQTNFVYANNVLRVADFVLQKGDSRFTIAGSVDLRSSPQVAGTLNVEQGRIEDVLGALQIFELSDFTRGIAPPTYGKLDTTQPLTIGASNRSNVSLKTQLERLAELNMQLKQLAKQRRSLVKPSSDGQADEVILPQFADIRGRFDSNMRFQFGAKGLTVDEFKLQARQLEWRPYPGYARFQRIGKRTAVVHNDNRVLKVQAFTVDASYTDGQLNLTRANAQIDQAQVNLQLNYGGENTAGQLTITKLPITQIQKFYPFPGNVVGELTAKATIGGSRENPNAKGSVTVSEGAINGRPVERARGFFDYNLGRMNLAASLKLAAPQPLRLTGEFPLPLPFIDVYPEDDTITADIKVKDEGLALLNLFDSPVKWIDGKGAVNLKVKGDLANIQADGLVALNDASFEVQGLPEPLTNVNGQVRFDRDLVRVEQLDGNFSRGNVAARGVIPLFDFKVNQPIPDGLPIENCLSQGEAPPLNIALNRISLTYKGLYQGGVRGCVNVAGNLFRPRITGEIGLFDGQVLLADEVPQAAAPGSSSNSRASVAQAASAVADSGLEFNDLRLKLGRNIQIVKAPIVNFVATGTLTVNGDLNAPQPAGEILLRSGVVNLFTTQFVLARGYRHRATFIDGGGLDPDLDIRLIASVPEVTRSPLRTPEQELSSEVTDAPLFATSVGSLQTVRIEAKVSGASSVLFDNLELSSSPSRSRNEIIGLIGGGFVDTLGRGDSTLGIANLAGSALLTNIQGFIGNALGLSEFRLFPTISTDEDRRSSTLGLAAEAGVDITPALSGSLLKILTSDQPAQFGLRYRINDNFLFRGSSDFFGDSRAVLEYNARF
ncbi:translocation/assembly module TamB domain-containing protein, partial [filamentous cyanobacterium LEGE 11480]